MWMKAGRRLVVAACIVGLASISACNSSPPEATSPTGEVSTSAPSGVSEEELRAWVEAAQLSPDVVGADKPIDEQTGVIGWFGICNEDLTMPVQQVYGHYARWSGSVIDYLEHGVYAYDGRGTEMVAAVRAAAQQCESYDVTDAYATARNTIDGEYQLAKPSGIDAVYAVCELSESIAPEERVGEQGYRCSAVLSRGQLAATALVFGPSLESAQSKVETAASMVAPALVDAVPTM